MPKWVKSKPKDWAPDKIMFLGYPGKLENIEWGYNQKKFITITEKGGKIKIAQIFYPGWQAYVNNEKVDISYDNEQGLMTINIPKGKNSVAFILQKTWWRQVADITSLTSIIAVFILILISVFNKIKSVRGR